MPPLDETQSPQPLGACYTLGELERVVARAINRYGSDTKIIDDERRGITIDAHFPQGEHTYVTISQIPVAYSDLPPENMV